MKSWLSFIVLALGLNVFAADAENGRKFMLEGPYFLNPPFTQLTLEEYDLLYLTWPDDLKERAKSSLEEKRIIAEARYGFYPMPAANEWDTKTSFFPSAVKRTERMPIGWVEVPNQKNTYEMSCVLCHGGAGKGIRDGALEDKFFIGVANTRLDFTTYFEDRIKLYDNFEKELPHTPDRDFTIGAAKEYLKYFPFNRTRGTFDAGPGTAMLLSNRDNDLNWVQRQPDPMGLVAVDVTVPVWWNTKYKSHLYHDAYGVARGKSLLLNFLAYTYPDAKKMEPLANDIYAFITTTVETPKYPLPEEIRPVLAAEGKKYFDKTCAGCHGSYEDDRVVKYPTKNVDLDDLGTDPYRLTVGNGPTYKNYYFNTYLADYGKADVRLNPKGYVAPPLRGISQSYPYFHNDSVPTLWHVLNPSKRPKIWKAQNYEFDPKNVGYVIEEVSQIPEVLTPDERRKYFDTSLFGKLATGHEFPDELSPAEKEAVLEYLKTL